MAERQPRIVAIVVLGIVGVAIAALVIGNVAGDDDGDTTVASEARDVAVVGDDLAFYEKDAATDPAVGVAAPVLHGESFAGDPVVIPGDTPAVVVFLAHWCPHCRREVPFLVSYFEENGTPDGVDVLSVATDIDPAAPNYPPSKWLADEGWTIPTLVDAADNGAAKAYGLSSYPYFVAIDADGNVVARATGELEGPALEALIDAARRMIPVVVAALSTEEVEACTTDGSAACVAVYRWTHNELLAKTADWFVAKPLTIAIVVVIAFVVTRLLTRAIRRFVRGVEVAASASASAHVRVTQRAETIGLVLRSLVRIIVTVVAGSTVLGELGVELGPLIVGAGIAGVALGFGAQSLVKDFLSGMFMLIEDQFGVGDVIDAGDAVGTVEAVSLRTTRIRSVDGTLWHVPNGSISRVGNKSQEWSRALLDVEVAYGVDLEKAQQVIKRAADELWHDPEFKDSVIEEPEVWGVEKLGTTGVVIRLVVKTRPADQWKVLRALRQRITAAFDEAGVATPGAQGVWIQPAS